MLADVYLLLFTTSDSYFSLSTFTRAIGFQSSVSTILIALFSVGISLALVIDGEPVVGVVYDPFTDSLYTAIKGKGAFKNNEKINVNDYNFRRH